MSKFKSVLQSRKFWALISSIITVGGAWYSGQVNGQDAANAAVLAFAAYSIATGIEGNGK